MDETGLSADRLSCRRGGRLVFENLSFHVPVGARAHLRGANGSGKSSLLRMLAGLAPPAAGMHRFKPKSDAGVTARRRLYVGHQNAIKPWMTVLENLEFWLAYTGSAADPGAVLADAGLAPLAELPAGYLSYGQSRRLALARLWAEPAGLVLLDEPMVGLDAAALAHLEGALTALSAQGATLVVAAHGGADMDATVTIDLDQVRP